MSKINSLTPVTGQEAIPILQKEVLTIDEVAVYTGLEKSYLYKLTHKRKIPHFKPTGKKLFFNRTEIIAWLQTNRVAPQEEVEARANTYMALQKGGVQ